MTRSIQLRGIRACRGRELRTKERLSLESLNSRTREYILVKQLGQLFFSRANVRGQMRLVIPRKGLAFRDNVAIPSHFVFSPRCTASAVVLS